MLGPNQTKWLEALESGEWAQGKSNLCRKENYCCLGVAAELFLPNEKLKHTSDDGTVVYHGSIGLAPWYVINALGLYSAEGQNVDGNATLVQWNDHGIPFKKIAQAIRAEPKKWFEEAR